MEEKSLLQREADYKMKKKHLLWFIMLTFVLMAVSACGSSGKKEVSEEQPAVTETPAPDLGKTLEEEKTDTSVQTAASDTAGTGTEENVQQAEEAESAETVPAEAEPAETEPAETETAAADAAETETAETAPAAVNSGAGLPVVTENPTDEKLTEGYSCMYIAEAENADSREWRAVSPDGDIDVSYTEISSYFPYLDYTGENGDALSLFNIPADFDGWGSYCRFKNSSGSTDSRVAVTHVTALKTVEAEKKKDDQ